MPNFKPGDKVWIRSYGLQHPEGVYAAVVVGPDPQELDRWEVNAEGISVPSDYYLSVPVSLMWPRDDPPPQEESKREAVGNWQSCVWKPAREVA